MTNRTRAIVTFSLFASRPEFHVLLQKHAEHAKFLAEVTFEELYECAVQSYLFAGFPAALEAVRAINRVWSIRGNHAEVNFAEEEARIRKEANMYAKYLERGDALYHVVYGANAGVVKQGLLRMSPELAGWAVTEGYGKTLSRSGLDTVTRELAIVAMLTQLGWDRQLYSHIIGARNVGASRNEIHEAITIGAYSNNAKEDFGLALLERLHA